MPSRGPDVLSPAPGFTTTSIDAGVKLRVKPCSPDDQLPTSVPRLLERSAKFGGDFVALTVRRDEEWKTWTYNEYLDHTKRAAKAFIKLGLEPRHGVCILGFNSPEWFIAQLASIHAGGISAGIYPTNNPESCHYIANHCEANILIVEDNKQLAKFDNWREKLPHLKAIVIYGEEPRGQGTEDGVYTWEQILEMGANEDNEELEARLSELAINKCCHLVYTSGTTGMPKGVMLSHDNLTWTSSQLVDIFHLKRKEERLVSYLPLSHVAANICDLFVMLTSVGTVYFADKDALKGTLIKSLRHAQPTLFFGVPRVWEKIKEKMTEAGRQNKGWKSSVGNWAKRTGLKYHQQVLSGNASNAPSLKYMVASTLVYSKVKHAIGLDKCLRFYCAAAPLSKEVLDYFLSLDMRVLEIYGMSECSGPQLSNTNEVQKIGSIGRQLPGLYNMISDEGEILAKGRHIMMGYLNDEEKTEAVFTPDGWLKSGDLGKIDAEGFVSITGRIKELIITAGGENVAPVVLEDNIKASLSCVSNVIVIGDKRKFLSCLLTLKTEVDEETQAPLPKLNSETKHWLKESGCSEDLETVDQASMDDLVRMRIQEGVDSANKLAPSQAQQIKKWTIVKEDFSVVGGELGPTLKMKRHVVTEKHAGLIEKIYK